MQTDTLIERDIMTTYSCTPGRHGKNHKTGDKKALNEEILRTLVNSTLFSYFLTAPTKFPVELRKQLYLSPQA